MVVKYSNLVNHNLKDSKMEDNVCSSCSGVGYVIDTYTDNNSVEVECRVECSACDGTGKE